MAVTEILRQWTCRWLDFLFFIVTLNLSRHQSHTHTHCSWPFTHSAFWQPRTSEAWAVTATKASTGMCFCYSFLFIFPYSNKVIINPVNWLPVISFTVISCLNQFEVAQNSFFWAEYIKEKAKISMKLSKCKNIVNMFIVYMHELQIGTGNLCCVISWEEKY